MLGETDFSSKYKTRQTEVEWVGGWLDRWVEDTTHALCSLHFIPLTGMVVQKSGPVLFLGITVLP